MGDQKFSSERLNLLQFYHIKKIQLLCNKIVKDKKLTRNIFF